MTSSRRAWLLSAGIVVSLGAHVGAFAALAPEKRAAPPPRHRVELAVLERQKTPPPPEPQKPKPKPVPRPVVAAPAPETKAAPPTPPPTFGISLSSTAAGGSFAVAVGRSTMGKPEPRPAQPPAPAPRPVVSANAVSRLPEKLGDCLAAYPTEAKRQGTQGKVLLDVEVGDDGRVGSVRVVRGLEPALDAAAVQALKACRFAPAELDGTTVATRIRYTYTFVIEG